MDDMLFALLPTKISPTPRPATGCGDAWLMCSLAAAAGRLQLGRAHICLFYLGRRESGRKKTPSPPLYPILRHRHHRQTCHSLVVAEAQAGQLNAVAHDNLPQSPFLNSPPSETL